MYEFGPFINRLDEIVYRLALYIDQSIYESASLYTNTQYDWIRCTVIYPQNSHLPRCRLLIPVVDGGEALRISDPIIL